MEALEITILVVSFIGLMLLGVPIAYSIGISSVLTILISIEPDAALTTVAQRMGNGLNSFTLLAIPFFVLAGQLMNKGGIAKRLIELAKVFVGPLPGGLIYINIIACMLFGAISGSAVAAATAIGGVMLPVMAKENYNKGLSASVNITSATTGMLIPPSNILIVYSLASGGASIAALFIAGYVPGILLGLCIAIVAGVIATRGNYPKGEVVSIKKAVKVFLEALPSLFLLVIVIGGIVAGIFTATEASAIAVLYTLVLAFIYKEIKIKDLPEILLEAVSISSIIMLLIAASMAMSWVMSFEDIPQQISNALLSISNDKIVILIIINLILLFIGIFMDMTPAVLIFTPIFLPVVKDLGVDPIHFGIIMVMNLSIGLCTPPVGSVLFVGASIAKVDIYKIIKPLLPLFLAMIAALFIVTFWEDLVLFLPRYFGF